MTKVGTCLWFDNQAAEAVKFYTSIFQGSEISAVTYENDAPQVAGGQVTVIAFELLGQRFTAFNGGPMFKFSEAVSIVVEVDTQAEIDRYWAALLEGGGMESMCGWLKDKYGLSWQIVPRALPQLMGGPDKARSLRVSAALMKMVKLDIAALEAAAAG